MDHALLWLLIFGPFIQAGLFALAPRQLWGRLGWFSALCAAGYLAIVVHFSFDLDPDATLAIRRAWVPQAMVNLSFNADGLGLFFSLLITGMGLLVSGYAQGYMNHSEGRIRKFYAYISIFMGSMLGAVLADNLIVLFVFWELTGVMSYLLIGYHHENADARKASRLAFLITSLSGLCLLIGVILIGILDHTLELSEVIQHGLIADSHPLWVFVIMVLILIGVYGKSAQFPLHFWLPSAMTAPTPVSAYLHSATMVKLGIYLVARIYVLFVDSALWFPLVTTFSMITVVMGGFFALFAYRLKQILAYATVSQLGFFISFYGLGSPEGLAYDYVHIFNHALYKGSLFMMVGILAHSAHVYDVRHLVGLRHKMPVFCIVFAVSLAAMAGLPGTTGFLSKELLVSDLVYATQKEPSGVVVVAGLLLGLLLKVAFSYRLFFYFFLNKAGESLKFVRRPSRKLYLPPFILSSFALYWGIWPNGLEQLSRNYFIRGLHVTDAKQIEHWHGFGLNLLISVCLFVGGFLLFQVTRRYERDSKDINQPDWASRCNGFWDAIPGYARRVTALWHRPHVSSHLSIICGASALLVGGLSWAAGVTLSPPEAWGAQELAQVLIIVSAIMLMRVELPMQRLIALSVLGFLVVYYFTLHQAPDLAMTQMLVEVATLFVLILLFYRLPRVSTLSFSLPRAGVALAAGCAVASIPALYSNMQSLYNLASFFNDNSLALAKGANVVNTILVDFRALDTLGEIAVVCVAVLGIVATHHRSADMPRHDPHSLIPSPVLPAIAPGILLIAIPFSLYLLLRGHDFPGGGFAGGMVLAISVVLVRISTRKWPYLALNRMRPLGLMMLGFSISLASACLSLLQQGGFLVARFYGGSALLSTPVLFDVGIFLLVIGAVNTVLVSMRARTLPEDLS